MKPTTCRNSSSISSATLPGDCSSFPTGALVPLDLMAAFVKGLLLLETRLSDVVALRFLGATYKEIGMHLGISTQLAEMRHKSALRKWPAFEAFFPEKVTRRARCTSRQ